MARRTKENGAGVKWHKPRFFVGRFQALFLLPVSFFFSRSFVLVRKAKDLFGPGVRAATLLQHVVLPPIYGQSCSTWFYHPYMANSGHILAKRNMHCRRKELNDVASRICLPLHSYAPNLGATLAPTALIPFLIHPIIGDPIFPSSLSTG